MLSTWFGDICGSRKDFCMFYKKSRTLYFKFYSGGEGGGGGGGSQRVICQGHAKRQPRLRASYVGLGATGHDDLNRSF